MNKTISFIIPTINRPSLQKTLASIGEWPGDQVIVVEDKLRDGLWGNRQRNEGMAAATCDYLAFMDDDDWYVPGAREIMDRAINQNPNGCPILFRMQYPDGHFIWTEEKVIPGNISSQMILVPNEKNMLYHWRINRNMADFIFVDKWGWMDQEIIWREEIICQLGHNYENKQS